MTAQHGAALQTFDFSLPALRSLGTKEAPLTQRIDGGKAPVTNLCNDIANGWFQLMTD